jgi:hypothetical protein
MRVRSFWQDQTCRERTQRTQKKNNFLRDPCVLSWQIGKSALAKFLFLIAFIAIGVACDHPPITNPTSTAIESPTAPPRNASISATPAPSATPEPIFVDEAECRAMCHEPDPDELLTNGAKILPANHADHKTCLNCHGTPNAPALPATHTGRMDPSCRVCHKPGN